MSPTLDKYNHRLKKKTVPYGCSIVVALKFNNLTKKKCILFDSLTSCKNKNNQKEVYFGKMLDLCRICLLDIDQASSVSIYFKMFDHKSIIEVIQECSSIELMEEDNLPKFICSKCIEKLDSFYEFRNLIIKSDTKLKNQFGVKKESSPSDEDTDNFSEECLAWSLVRTEAKEDSEASSNKGNENPLVPDDLEEGSQDSIKTTKRNLRNHLKKQETIEGKVSEGYTGIKRQRKRRLYECKECNAIFKSPYSFKNHNIKHTGVKPFSCEFCGKGFSMKWALTIHTRVHTGDKPFTCDVCQKTFGSPSGLNIHQKIHKGEKKFSCEVCNKGFYQSCHLRNHMRLHTGEKPFMCEVCSKMFRDSSSLVRHMERHQQTEKLPCPICGSLHKRQRDLQQHIKRHSGSKPFICSECGQRFTMQASLTRHKLLHSGIKPFKCKVCEKSFSQGSILMRHMRIHSGEKPFPCKLCPKEFAYKHHLQGHMKNYHDVARENAGSAGDTENVVDPVT